MLFLVPLAASAAPLVEIASVTPDPCGVLHGELAVTPRRKDREVLLRLDGLRVGAVSVPGRAERAPFEVFVGAGRSGALTATWKFVDSAPVEVFTPRWEVVLAADVPAEPPPQGEVPPLAVRALGPCAAPPLTVDARVVELDRPLAHRAPLGAVLPLDLPAGTWTLALALVDGTSPIATREVSYVVGPPCLDEDGDGAQSCRAGDCDDHDPAVHPGATDIVGDGIDQDCDGRNGQDRDRDGHEDRAVGGDDCDDGHPGVHAGATSFPDADRDGAVAVEVLDFDCDGEVERSEAPFDCDDGDPQVPREELPVPNQVDDDCDGLVDEGTVAFDDDGDGLAELAGDCDDTDQGVFPGAREEPDCRDQDCDGQIDDGVTRPAADDRWEPNDADAKEVPGAYWRSGLFGGSWRKSRTEVRAVTRDLSDLERYQVFAHDGDLDTFHVSVRVERLGDGRSYELAIVGPDGHQVTGTAARGGDGLTMYGRAGRSDSGDYVIEVRPLAGELPWCPVQLVISTG